MAKLKEIKVEFGVSQSTSPGNWLKATAGLTVELETPEDAKNYKEIYADAWERVTREVAEQLSKLDVEE